jgi:two-component system response regulator HydG
MNPSIILVDDDAPFLIGAGFVLRSAGITDFVAIEDSRKVLPYLAEHDVAVIVLDLTMPHIRGEDLLLDITRRFPHVRVLIMTGVNEIETAVECMRAGAFDYLVKPVENNRFVSSIKNALCLNDMDNEISMLKKSLLSEELEQESVFSSIITADRKMHALFRYSEVVAKSRQPVLITGETGSGKELIARAIHALSGLTGRFIEVNIAGLDDSMFADALFGHRKGAFTGAEEQREGMIVQASGGTLFLDEIGDLRESSQVKLLHLLDEGRFFPLGSDVEMKSGARVIVATNRDLHRLISEGKFRNDLYYRIRGHQINVPPLRERAEDIPLLTDHFLKEAAISMNKKKPSAPPELYTLLSTHNFPGNVRELRAMVFDAVTRHSAGVLSLDSFKEIMGITSSTSGDLVPVNGDRGLLSTLFGHPPTLKEMEGYMIEEALSLSKGNQGIAATLLGISRQALNKRLMRNGKDSRPQTGKG